MGDSFRAMRADSKERRHGNRNAGAQLLATYNVPFESKNAGAHLIVREDWDYWPGTGRWSHRKSTANGRGIFALLKALNVPPVEAAPEADHADPAPD